MASHNLQSSIDNKALYDLRDEIKDLNKNLKSANKANTALTIVLILVGIIQLVIVGFQLAVATYGSNWKGYLCGIVLEIVDLLGIYYVLRKILPKEAKNK